MLAMLHCSIPLLLLLLNSVSGKLESHSLTKRDALLVTWYSIESFFYKNTTTDENMKKLNRTENFYTMASHLYYTMGVSDCMTDCVYRDRMRDWMEILRDILTVTVIPANKTNNATDNSTDTATDNSTDTATYNSTDISNTTTENKTDEDKAADKKEKSSKFLKCCKECSSKRKTSENEASGNSTDETSGNSTESTSGNSTESTSGNSTESTSGNSTESTSDNSTEDTSPELLAAHNETCHYLQDLANNLDTVGTISCAMVCFANKTNEDTLDANVTAYVDLCCDKCQLNSGICNKLLKVEIRQQQIDKFVKNDLMYDAITSHWRMLVEQVEEFPKKKEETIEAETNGTETGSNSTGSAGTNNTESGSNSTGSAETINTRSEKSVDERKEALLAISAKYKIGSDRRKPRELPWELGIAINEQEMQGAESETSNEKLATRTAENQSIQAADNKKKVQQEQEISEKSDGNPNTKTVADKTAKMIRETITDTTKQPTGNQNPGDDDGAMNTETNQRKSDSEARKKRFINNGAPPRWRGRRMFQQN